jgi:hypothetical protein
MQRRGCKCAGRWSSSAGIDWKGEYICWLRGCGRVGGRESKFGSGRTGDGAQLQRVRVAPVVGWGDVFLAMEMRLLGPGDDRIGN